MRKWMVALFGLFTTCLVHGQTDNQKLVELGKVYKDFMFRNDPVKADLKEVKEHVADHLLRANEFIIQTVTKDNKLLSEKFLSRPDDQTLKQIYIIRAINLNLREENQVENNKLVDSLTARSIPVYVLLDNYYAMLFTAVGNKNQPFNLSKADIRLKDYNLRDDTEKGILFLQAMKYCGTAIWGYINIAKPANTQKAYDFIKLFPKFNGRPYYQYTDFYFSDFDMNIIEGKGPQSYKSYYLDKYYETLLSHLLCLSKEGGSENEKNDLLLGSILKERSLYKYTKYKETLESIFNERKND